MKFVFEVYQVLRESSPELAYQILASLPRARLATIQRRLAPLLQFDVVGVSFLLLRNSKHYPSDWHSSIFA